MNNGSHPSKLLPPDSLIYEAIDVKRNQQFAERVIAHQLYEDGILDVQKRRFEPSEPLSTEAVERHQDFAPDSPFDVDETNEHVRLKIRAAQFLASEGFTVERDGENEVYTGFEVPCNYGIADVADESNRALVECGYMDGSKALTVFGIKPSQIERGKATCVNPLTDRMLFSLPYSENESDDAVSIYQFKLVGDPTNADRVDSELETI